MTTEAYWALSPVIAMAVLSLLTISADAVLNERWKGGRRWGDKSWLVWIAAIGLLAPLFFTLNLWFGWIGESTADSVLFGSFTADRFTLFFQFLLIGATVAVVIASAQYLQQFSDSRGEFLGLTLFSATGMMLLVGASELITIYVALETTALPIVALAGLRRDGFAVEAGVKFLILSALSTAILLFGFVFLYGYTGATQLSDIAARIALLSTDSSVPFGSTAVLLSTILIIAGFGFKMAIAPWQMWVPDVYQGSPTPVAAFLSVASKASAFAVLMRLLYQLLGSGETSQDWQILFAVIAVISMTFGNLLALSQNNVKRILAYSTIAQAGYIMVGLAAISVNSASGSNSAGPQSVMYYLAGYAFTNLAVFLAYTTVIHRITNPDISGLNGLIRRSPFIAIMMVIGLLSLLGMPPTVGFMAKAVIFSTAVDQGLVWLAIVAVLNTVIAAYYYLRIVAAIIFAEPETDEKINPGINELASVAVAVAGAIALGIVPAYILDLVDRSITIL